MQPSLTISSIELYPSRIKLQEPFVISLGLLEYAENVLVMIKTKENITGIGECSPFMTINGENMETGLVVGKYLATALKGKDPLNIEECTQLMDRVIYGNSSIKSAFDMALYDIAAQHANMPLYQFLGGKNDKKLITDYTVSIGPVAKMASDALKIKTRGFQVIKVKLGGSPAEDIERIHAIRAAVGFEIPIRIDANQGWKTHEVIDILNALAPYNIQHCEEPISRALFMDLPQLRTQSPIPIMADESCCDHMDAQRLIDLKACDLLNLKLGKSSGIYKAQKIIQIAEKNQINIQIGGFLESRLGFTAAAHLALTSKNIIHCDFDTPLMFIEDPVEGGITYDQHGVVSVPEKPGLGATIQDDYLKNLSGKIVI
jgi:L-alanine-DL-glutamate epimerase-like enolase superfamily enzyme